MKKRNGRTIQGYDVEMAIEFGVVTAIIWDKVSFWGNKGADKNGWVYKTYDDMFEETGLKVDAVRAAYNKLKSMELIEIKTKKVNGTPKLHFRLLEFPLSEIQLSENGNSNSPINIQNTTTELSVSDLAVEQQQSGGVAKNTAILQKLIDIVNPREKVTKDRLRTLGARLKEYSEEDVTRAAMAFSSSDWHKENKLMNIDLLLAPSKFGKWYDQGQTIPEWVMDKKNPDKQAERRYTLWLRTIDTDAFRNSRREEFNEAVSSDKLNEYLDKYGLDHYVDKQA